MDKEENRKHAHNAKIRKKLLTKAAPLFRDRGPDNVGIDEVMARAGMTRGAFYAHFKSKEDAFLAALHQETPLLTALERRVSQDQAGLLSEMRGVFESYLRNGPTPTSRSCTLAGLAMDVTRGSDEARATHEAIQHAVRVEMARGQGVHHDDAIVHAALSLAVGSVLMAGAQRTEPGRQAVLDAGRRGVQDLLDGFGPDESQAPVPQAATAPAKPVPPPRPPMAPQRVATTMAAQESPSRTVTQRPLTTPPGLVKMVPRSAGAAPSAAAIAELARARSVAGKLTGPGDLPRAGTQRSAGAEPRHEVPPKDPREQLAGVRDRDGKRGPGLLSRLLGVFGGSRN